MKNIEKIGTMGKTKFLKLYGFAMFSLEGKDNKFTLVQIQELDNCLLHLVFLAILCHIFLKCWV
jgi:hypothetical protein